MISENMKSKNTKRTTNTRRLPKVDKMKTEVNKDQCGQKIKRVCSSYGRFENLPDPIFDEKHRANYQDQCDELIKLCKMNPCLNPAFWSASEKIKKTIHKIESKQKDFLLKRIRKLF